MFQQWKEGCRERTSTRGGGLQRFVDTTGAGPRADISEYQCNRPLPRAGAVGSLPTHVLGGACQHKHRFIQRWFF